jgi:hypothetical protein
MLAFGVLATYASPIIAMKGIEYDLSNCHLFAFTHLLFIGSGDYSHRNWDQQP